MRSVDEKGCVKEVEELEVRMEEEKTRGEGETKQG